MRYGHEIEEKVNIYTEATHEAYPVSCSGKHGIVAPSREASFSFHVSRIEDGVGQEGNGRSKPTMREDLT
jgi:hypothetical protein